MYVIKRNQTREIFKKNKILSRISKLSKDLDHINNNLIIEKVIKNIYNEITTSNIDKLSSELCGSLTTNHPNYSVLASRIALSDLYKETCDSFSKTIYNLYKHNIISQPIYEIVKKNETFLDNLINEELDNDFDYFGFKTLESIYLLRIKNKVVERPQYLFLRVSIEIHRDNLDKVKETYDLMSKKFFIHASPTLMNSGTNINQLCSCFVLGIFKDDISNIYSTLAKCAEISQLSGGIGLHIHNCSQSGSALNSSHESNGIVPMIKVFNETAKYINQGNNKRPSAIAIYLEVWHGEIKKFLELKLNSGVEDIRARNLFYGIWIPDLFMKRVQMDEKWSLMCPSISKGLSDVYGEDFNILYEKYEREGKFTQQVKAKDIFFLILKSLIETGGPYILFKDACNYKSNQKNSGTIYASNLCCEILQITSEEEIAVCNLASISLKKFVTDNNEYDFDLLKKITKIVTINLNKIIDRTYYPIKEAKISNKRHRPIGIGVQGLADTFLKLKIPYDSEDAKKLNKEIFETIYFGALEASMELAKSESYYDSFPNSPIAKGIVQFDLWNKEPTGKWPWKALKEQIIKYGVRNSLLTALMPTASTSQIFGNVECFEPITSNIFIRRVISGEFQVINKYLIQDLIDHKLWNDEIKTAIIKNSGSIQNINQISDKLKRIYKTVWEIPQKHLIEMAADRAIFIDQSQSFNMYNTNPNTLAKSIFYAWELGLKTGSYYQRTKPAYKPRPSFSCSSCNS